MKKAISFLGFLMILFAFSSSVYAQDVSIITGVKVTTPPVKVNYKAGELLDLTGLVVTISSKSNGISVDRDVIFSTSAFSANGITTSPANGTSLFTGNKVVIRVGGKTVSQAITVTRPVKFEVKQQPYKTTYTFGEKLNLAGLIVTLIKSDGTREDVVFSTQAVFESLGFTTTIKDGGDIKSTDKRVTVSYGKFKVNIPIVVNVNIACVKDALSLREQTVAASVSTFTNSVAASLQTRKAALLEAWDKTVVSERNKAINTAWTNFKTAQNTARGVRLVSVKDAWSKWKTDVKLCGTTSTEPQGLDNF